MPDDFITCLECGKRLRSIGSHLRTAHDVAYALCKAEHERLGWDPDDSRIQYPGAVSRPEEVQTTDLRL